MLQQVFEGFDICILNDVYLELIAPTDALERDYVKEILDQLVLQDEALDTGKKRWIRRLRINKDQLVIEKQLIEEYPYLHKGELSSIALALDTNSILLIDDRGALHAAKDAGVEAYSLVEMLLMTKHSGILSRTKLKKMLNSLKEKDGYELCFKNQ